MIETIQNSASVWLSLLGQPRFWWQIAILALAVMVAYGIRSSLTGDHTKGREVTRLRRMSRKGFHRIQFPISMLLITWSGQVILNRMDMDTPLLAIATPLLLSLAGIRIAVYILRKGFASGPLVKAWENLIAALIWGLVALHLLGWLPDLLAAMDSLAFKLGDNRISLLMSVKLILTVAFSWILALCLANFIEQHLRKSEYISSSARVALGKFSKFFLVAIAILFALDAVGIDLTTLTVFGGAVGVGIGFGLQRITSNFISGFILLLDRSIKPGDVITVRDKFGWVQELRARYIVVRDRDGVETLIPNENLVTSEVINWSYTDPDVRLKIRVQISYDDDPERAMGIMLDCARASPRVMDEPLPLCRFIEFADSGMVLELRIWIADPENGLGGVSSEINLAIWKSFKKAGITIPYPQRDVHIKGSVADSAA